MACIVLGCFAGFLSGLLGIGGGVVIVPVLLLIIQYALDIPESILMHVTAATTLSAITLTAIAGVRARHQDWPIIWSIFRQMMVGTILGVIIGVLFADLLHSRILEIGFGFFLIIISLRLFWVSNLSEQKENAKLPSATAMQGVGLAVGFKSGLFGIGGGAITVPYLLHAGVKMRHASGVAGFVTLTVGFHGALTGVIAGLNEVGLPSGTIGYVYLPATFLIALPSLLFAPLGVRMSAMLPVGVLKMIFGTVLFINAIHMLW